MSALLRLIIGSKASTASRLGSRFNPFSCFTIFLVSRSLANSRCKNSLSSSEIFSGSKAGSGGEGDRGRSIIPRDWSVSKDLLDTRICHEMAATLLTFTAILEYLSDAHEVLAIHVHGFQNLSFSIIHCLTVAVIVSAIFLFIWNR
jgi:hypothetical protein